jgi:hypothetical protein
MCAVVRVRALMAQQAARLITNPPIVFVWLRARVLSFFCCCRFDGCHQSVVTGRTIHLAFAQKTSAADANQFGAK